MSEKKLGVAIIGFGGMGFWHSGTIAKIPEITLTGIYDIDPKRTDLASRSDIPVYAGWEAILEDPAVDVVTIALPNELHHPKALQAMRAGKHVVCEKPVAMNYGELKEMLDVAREEKVLFTVHQNRRWDEDYLIVKQLYDTESLGRAIGVESRVHGSRGIPGDWRGKKENGGGMLLDWGVHLLDQALQMMGSRKLLRVYGELFHITTSEVDDGYRAILHFEDELTFLTEVGTSNFIEMPRWYLQGTNGSAIVNDWSKKGEVVKISNWEKRDAIPVVTAAGLTKTMAPRTEETISRFPLPDIHADITDYYKNIREVVYSAAQPIVKGGELLKSMCLMETISEAALKGQILPFAFASETEEKYNAPYPITQR